MTDLIQKNNDLENFIDIRVFYSKTSRAKYISHLDISRLMQRSLKRSKLNIWYTQGFNPHMYIGFALPLSLGFDSIYEVMDLRILKNDLEKYGFMELKQIINLSLPEDIKVFKIDYPIEKSTKITHTEYNIKVYGYDIEYLFNVFEEILNKDEIMVDKKTKKGIKQINIKPDIEVTNITKNQDVLEFTFKAVAGTENNVNPNLLINLLKNNLVLNNINNEIFSIIKREKIFINDKLFV